ncbi:hypothetical protein BGHDH14_bgh05163, partial [Blumeria hordei DH14]
NSIPDEQNSFRAPIPRMHLWPTAMDDAENINDNNWESDMHETVSNDEIPVSILAQECPENLDPQSVIFKIIMIVLLMCCCRLNALWRPTIEVDEKSIDEYDRLTDCAKLKGVLWPGMDLFDSATLEQKRMRNQRKGNDVLADMIYTSRQVEPAEVSYHASGEFRASRDIFGPLSGDDSPVKNPTPKKRKPVRKASALGDLSTNAPRLRATRAKKCHKQPTSPKKHCGLATVQFPQSLNPLTTGLSCNRNLQPTTEEDEEFRLTLSEAMNGKKRVFSIFQDTPANSPGRTESPLQDHQFDFATSLDLEDAFVNDRTGRIQEQAIGPFSSQVGVLSNIVPTSPSPISIPPQNQFFCCKENRQPDIQTTSAGPRSLSSSHVYLPQLCYDPLMNPLYHHGYSRSYSCASQVSNSESKSVKSPAFDGDLQIPNPLANFQESLIGSQKNSVSDLQYEL